MTPDRLQQVWQSQSDASPEINPDRLLREVRVRRRVYFWTNVVIISIALYIGGSMLRTVFQDARKNWPWLFMVASEVWIVGYIFFSQWRGRRRRC